MNHQEKCALCGEYKELKDSHLIPQWAYRRLQQSEQGRDDPIRIADGTAVRTSKQVTKHLLCGDCEQRFSKPEDYVARLTEIDAPGKLKILGNITRADPPHSDVAKLATEIDTKTIAYFAASVIWRSCVMDNACKLGKYEPSFRRYLMGETDFPREASLSMLILEPSRLTARPERLVTFPSSLKTPFAWLHGFIICGLAFRCFVGRSLNAQMKTACLAGDGPVKYAYMMRAQEFGDFFEACKTSTAAIPRGKLARVGGTKAMAGTRSRSV
ncbi:hypothetical protein [Burkholderia ubonensis]|uniref:hypothetical protein n=1 Tax=Burkholderia ubonensis TaxID=101571 RepID=UPI000AAD2BB4|nr:hypothetical protein [Burkholderia ubonensis]